MLFILSTSIISQFAPALLADDLPAARLTLASGDPASTTSGSLLHLVSDDSGDSLAEVPLARQEFSSSTATTSTSVANHATSRLFSHSKWKGPTGIAGLPYESGVQWKGAFRSRRQSFTAADSGVVQTSGELPLGTVQPVSLPNPPRMSLSDSPDLPPLAKPQVAEPPLPVQITPPTEPSAAPLPTLEQQIAGQTKLAEKCISPRDLKSIRKITADISVKPEDLTGSKRLPPECSLDDTPMQPRHWRNITFAWTAAGTCHNPLYFEDEQLERYGHTWGPVKQTAVSAVRFFATVPFVPYFMGVYPPNECIYDLGQYRPGSCAPYYLDPLPISIRGALYEGTFLGLIPVAL